VSNLWVSGFQAHRRTACRFILIGWSATRHQPLRDGQSTSETRACSLGLKRQMTARHDCSARFYLDCHDAALLMAREPGPVLRRARRCAGVAQEEGVDVELAKRIEDAYNAPEEDDVDSDPHVVRPWSIETRVRDHRELRAEREKSDREKRKNMDKLMLGDPMNKSKPRREGFDPLPSDPNQRVFQKNEGEWTFDLGESDDRRSVVLDVDIGKYIDASLVDVDVQPRLVRMLCKGRLLQLELFDEVNPDKSVAQRSKTTGHLVITMPKVKEVLQASNMEPNRLPMKKVTGGNHKSNISLAGVSSLDINNMFGGQDMDIHGAAMKERPKQSALMDGDSDSDDDVPPFVSN